MRFPLIIWPAELVVKSPLCALKLVPAGTPVQLALGYLGKGQVVVPVVGGVVGGGVVGGGEVGGGVVGAAPEAKNLTALPPLASTSLTISALPTSVPASGSIAAK